MKHRHLHSLIALGLLSPLLTSAQVTVPKPAVEDAIVLSPFVVDATTDTGYQATSTLAGSRLKTELKDVAASVTVLTNEFMDDLGATDIAGALAFVAGAENDFTTDPTGTNSLNQGYVGGDFGDVNNRSGEVRVRGLGRASTTANYIQIMGSTDRYNTERAEFLRGANSILFGLAEPAGMVNFSTKMASLRKDAVKVETKVDNYGTRRAVLDVSRVLIKDRLAFRAVGLHSDTRYELDTAFQRDKRLFLTGTYQPFKGTTLRANYETQNTQGRRPNFRTVQDNVSEWLNAYNQYAKVLTPAQLAAAFYWDPTTLTATGTPLSTLVTTTTGQTVDLGLIRRPLDGNANGTVMYYTGADWNNPQANTVTIFSNRTVTGAATSGATRSAFARSASSRENTALFNDPQVTSRGIFPYDSIDIGALPGNYRWERDHKVNVTLDQRVTEDLYLSASFQQEKRTHEQQFNPISQTHQISIDVNTKLPDGRTNPNFLRPFIYGRSLGEATDATATNWLVQANYDFDFAKKAKSSKWLSRLGFHRLTSLYTSAKTDRFRYQYNYQLDNSIPGMDAASVASGNAARNVYQVWYVGDPVQAGDTGLRFTGFPTTTAAQVDRSYDYLYYNNTSRVWTTSPQQVHIGRQLVAGGRSFTEQNNDGTGFSLQSFFWKRKIVTLFGWRQDDVESFNHALTSDPFPFPTIAGASRNDYIKGPPQFTNKTATTTKSIVFHATDWLRVFANRSENFAATTPRQDNLYRPLAPQSGQTDEAGLGLNLLEGKLNLRTSVFKSAQVQATSAQASATAGLRVVAFEDSLYNALNSAGRLAEWTTYSDHGMTTDRYERPLNAAATEDSVSKGVDVELVYRPTPGWDISMSVSKLKNLSTNVGRELGEFLALRAPFYRKYFQEGMRIDGTTNRNPSGQTLLTDRFISQVAANYTSDIIREGTSNRGVSEYTAKLVTRYNFREGLLKGVTVGGNLRWEQGKIIGYQQTPAVFNVGGLDGVTGQISDTTRPHISDAILAGGLVTNYSRRIFSGRVRWKVQLNAQNLIGDHGLRVIAANPDASPIWGLAPARTYELTNTFEF